MPSTIPIFESALLRQSNRQTAWIGFGLLPVAIALLLHSTEQVDIRVPPLSLSGWVLLATLVAATTTDLATRRIPNYITYPALAWLFLIAATVDLGIVSPSELTSGATVHQPSLDLSMLAPTMAPLSLSDAILGTLACFGVMFVVFLCAGSGGGDVKLAAVIGAGLGVEIGFTSLAVAHIVAGVCGISWAVLVLGPKRVAISVARSCGSLLLPTQFAPAGHDRRSVLAVSAPAVAVFSNRRNHYTGLSLKRTRCVINHLFDDSS